MKATGIVRRIDGRDIIGQTLKDRINTGFSLILSNFQYRKSGGISTENYEKEVF